ncbi:transcriptional regulator FtrA [Roseibium litorale]|uniref:Transcriptional regulator FtrA n=1 Tax=Roseibium litorale TaxID=2803841 RepID=A0ABR9CHJ8_9HYPH|nr:transcriptional regulator FtrA [Roseibium litorale]MBD8890318.1 transcriptional regulator FtrA [Roseibium litorale]
MPTATRTTPASPSAPQSSSGPLVVALAYDGLCMFEFGIAVEVFGLPRPEMGADWYRFAIAPADAGEIRSTAGLRLAVDGGLELLEQADIIIIPGWRGADAPVPEGLCAALREAHKRGARLLTICSGVFVLAATGLLEGLRVTTHWRYTDGLQERYPQLTVIPDVLYVDEGQILTSAGSAAGIDLCLHLIRQDRGPDAANSVARRLVMPAHREGGQAQFIDAPVPRYDEGARLGPVLDLMRKDLSGAHRIRDLALASGMSTRTFLRRFEAATGTTPARWLLSERLHRAKDLLESTHTGIGEIASLCGFGSATNLRHHFRKMVGITPTAYRSSFAILEQS